MATEVNTELREDNHQGTPPLMIVRATVRRASSCPTSAGVHVRMIRSWDVRKAFFNVDLNEVIYVHTGTNLCKAGHCWWLRKALHGTHMASQMWGDTVRAVMDSGGCHCLQSVPVTTKMIRAQFAIVMTSWLRVLSELDRLLNEHFEVSSGNMIGPGKPGQTRYLKRIIDYTEDLPEHGGPGFFWTADPKHVDFLVQWT